MQRQALAVLGCAVAASWLQGCAIVKSVPAANGSAGIAYMLPRALLPVELVYDGSSLELRITAPVLVGDVDHTYALERSGNIFSSDNVTVTVEAATGLLSAIDVKSEDNTIPAIVRLISGLKAEAGADAVTTVVVFRGLFDPGWAVDRVNAFNRDLSDAAEKHVGRLVKENSCDKQGAPQACIAINALAADVKAAKFKVNVEGAVGEPHKLADCGAGFCYRINVPHVVTLSGPGTTNSAVFGLPNRSPTFVMPLERWAFVKTTHDVKFEGGVFKSIATDRPSSAFAVASAPLDIAKAVLTAVAEVVQLKIDLSGKEKALADAKVAEIEAKAALDKALLDKGGEKAEAAILGESTRNDMPLLSIRLGQPSQLDATKNLVGVKPSSPASAAGNPEEAKSKGKTVPGSSGK
jgi:hypothetical protein